MIACIGFYGNLFFGFIAKIYYTYEEQYHVQCFMTVFGEYLCTLSGLIVPLVLMFRYLSLINVNFHKEKLMQASKVSETAAALPLRVPYIESIHITDSLDLDGCWYSYGLFSRYCNCLF
jgi:hypothetical protein